MSDRTPSPSARSGGWFADRPIGVKIGAAVVLLAAVAVGMTILAVSRITALESGASRINDNVVTLADLANIQRSWQGDRARYSSYGLTDPQTRAELVTELAERRTTLEGQLDAYAEVTVNREAFETFRGHIDDYRDLSAGVTRRSEVEPGSGQEAPPAARSEPNLLQGATAELVTSTVRSL